MNNKSSDQKNTRPVRPRDAATLIVYRGDGHTSPVEVVMGRRVSKASFMPNVYVFPGGGVDRADARVTPATKLPSQMSEHMAVAHSVARAQTIAMAAIRETFEETGLFVTLPGKVANRQTPASWQPFLDRRIAPNLAVLHYLGRALTPTHRPIRFHARFFAVHERYISGALASSDELLDVDWYPANSTLRNDHELPLMGVTKRMLEEVSLLAAGNRDASTYVGGLFYSGRANKRFATGKNLVDG